MAALMSVSFLLYLKLSRSTGMFLAIGCAFVAGGILSLAMVDDLTGDIILYVITTAFLLLSAVFIAAVIESDPLIVATIFRAYLCSAVVTALLGIAGYFQLLPFSDLLTRYGRATSTFQDPNVFGPFLVLPACYLLYRIFNSGASGIIQRAVVLVVLTIAIFLSFSRAAWGLYLLCSIVLVFITLLIHNSAVFRLRILLLSMIGLLAAATAIAILMQFPAVSKIFVDRAQLVQSYDAGQFGRFSNHRLGFALALESPLGIGPFSFSKKFGEDPHNIWLKSLVAYGWVGFVAFLALVACTLTTGFRSLLRERPWQPYLICAYVVFVGHIAMSTIIDTDHWRHLFILFGIIWGCIGLEIKYQRPLFNADQDTKDKKPPHSATHGLQLQSA